MKKKKLGFILILSVWFVTSCDYVYNYTYQVTNNTDTEVKIKVETFRIDSTYSVSANETQILFITDHGIEDSKGPYFADVTEDLIEFIVAKDDKIISLKDYLDNSSWNYNDGLYHAIIEDSEFE